MPDGSVGCCYGIKDVSQGPSQNQVVKISSNLLIILFICYEDASGEIIVFSLFLILFTPCYFCAFIPNFILIDFVCEKCIEVQSVYIISQILS